MFSILHHHRLIPARPKSVILTSALFLLLSLSGMAQVRIDSVALRVREQRIAKNQEFIDTIQSPLVKSDIPTFTGLIYFEYNPRYRMKAVLKKNPNPKVFKMTTTTDRRPEYRTYGEVAFNLDGKDYALQVYQRVEPIRQPGYDKYLFLPFTDETSGRETYGGGRFLDVFIPDGDSLFLDFNQCYNPYCAYNHKYSCPIPPDENDLPIKILAGEKPWKK